MRLYKRTYGLRQICNIAVYMVHSACTIHLLNVPEKTAKRDIVHGVKHLEEIAEDWLCARRTLSILSVLARKWKIDLPDEATAVFTRTDSKYGHFSTADVPSPKQELLVATPPPNASMSPQMPPVANRVPNQTQLHQSMYSYLPDSRNTTSNPQMVSNVQQPTQMNRGVMSTSIGGMNIPNQQVLSSVPYNRYSDSHSSMRAAMTPNNDLPRNNSASETSTITRQVSPNTMFGGVEALVESQDWWLRDQANLFGAWQSFSGVPPQDMVDGPPMNGVMNENRGSDAARDLDNMAGIAGGFYMPNTGNGNMNIDGFEDDWTYT